MDRRIHLKVKVKALAAEARIIRHAERKFPHSRESLYLHRTLLVRRASRHAQLAYACLRGRPYAEVERCPKTSPYWGEVLKLVQRFGTSEEYLAHAERKQHEHRLKLKWQLWSEAAAAHLGKSVRSMPEWKSAA